MATEIATSYEDFLPLKRPARLEMFAVPTKGTDYFARGGTDADGHANNLKLSLDDLGKPFTLMIIDENGNAYHAATYSIDPKDVWGRALTAMAEGQTAYKGARYDLTPGKHGGLKDCGEATAMDGGPCFLTTATVGTLGLPDDCWELRQLRAFRDRFADRGPTQRAMMADYYRIAPQIVRRVNARPDRARIWIRVYFTSILPAAVAAWFGSDRLALSIYRKLVGTLQAM